MNRILLDNNQLNCDTLDSIDITSSKNVIKINITKDTTLDVNITNSNTNIEINVLDNVKVKLNIIAKNTTNNIIYNLSDSSEVITNKLVVDNSDTVTVNLNKPLASIIYNYSAINYKSSTYKIDIKHNAKKTNSNVFNHAISMTDEKTIFNINGYVYKDSCKCICNQDNKIIYMKSNTSTIKPNLFIENYDVEANHSAYIGTFNDKELFYLMSRGIKKDDCYKLFRKSFILGKMILDKEETKNFQETLKNIF